MRRNARAEAAEARCEQLEEWLRFYAPDDVNVDDMMRNAGFVTARPAEEEVLARRNCGHEVRPKLEKAG